MLILLYVHLLLMLGNAVDIPVQKGKKAKAFDYKAEDFCNLKCTKGEDGTNEENVGCHCNKKKSPKTCAPYKTDQLVQFRKTALTVHNELRNRIASGDETNPNAGKGSNINAISYDLGLEFAAMCTSMKCIMDHDHCRKMKKFHHTGQNLYFGEMSEDRQKNRKSHYTSDTDVVKAIFKIYIPLDTSIKLLQIKYVFQRYDELKLMPAEVIDNFAFQSAYGHFTAMVWATITHIGCAITSNKKPPGKPAGHLNVMITCNYGILNNSKEGINVLTQPVYIRGEPASACPEGKAPNSLFPALCGNIDPIPIAKLVPHSGGACISCHFVWVVMILVLSLFLVITN